MCTQSKLETYGALIPESGLNGNVERFNPGDETNERSLSFTVIENVAGHKGTEALMLDPPLYEVLDPDALNALFAGRGEALSGGELSFDYCGCTVTVSSDGHVLVEDKEDQTAGEPTTA